MPDDEESQSIVVSGVEMTAYGSVCLRFFFNLFFKKKNRPLYLVINFLKKKLTESRLLFSLQICN